MTTIPLYLSNRSLYDFSEDLSQVLTTGNHDQLTEVSNYYTLLAGDMDGNGEFRINDYNVHYLGESASVNGYYRADLNMDGNVTVADFNLYQSHISVLGTIIRD